MKPSIVPSECTDDVIEKQKHPRIRIRADGRFEFLCTITGKKHKEWVCIDSVIEQFLHESGITLKEIRNDTQLENMLLRMAQTGLDGRRAIAGKLSRIGRRRILHDVPETISKRVQAILGNKEEI